MKKLLTIAVGFAVLAITSYVQPAQAQAQQVTSAHMTTPRTPVLNNLKDTSTNGSTALWRASVPGFQSVVALQVKLTNISGTTAGKVTLEGSVDGTNFVRIPSILQTTGAVGLDSLNASSSALSKIFVVDKHAYTKYQIKYIGGSSSAVSGTAEIIWRRQP